MYLEEYEKTFGYKTTNQILELTIAIEKEFKEAEIKYQEKIKKQKEKEKARLLAEEEEYSNNIQYSAIAIFVILLFVSLFIIPKFNISFTLIDGLVFITFLLFYELIVVIFEPKIDEWTDGIPIFKLGLNLLIALLFIPVHNYEGKFRDKFTDNK